MSRGILALFWFGVQSAGGGTAVTQIITAIWPSYGSLHSSLPASASITSKGLISYFMYHVLHTPFLFIRPDKLKWMFLAKTILVPPMALAMVIYLAVAVRGTNAPEFWNQKSTVTGSNRAWLWLASMRSITGGFSTSQSTTPISRASPKSPAPNFGSSLHPAIQNRGQYLRRRRRLCLQISLRQSPMEPRRHPCSVVINTWWASRRIFLCGTLDTCSDMRKYFCEFDIFSQ
jgi:hypothetical protein